MTITKAVAQRLWEEFMKSAYVQGVIETMEVPQYFGDRGIDALKQAEFLIAWAKVANPLFEVKELPNPFDLSRLER